MYNEAEKHLKSMLGSQAKFRDGQWEAIQLALQNRKALIVQQTGWGKSIVYFIATKMLGATGKGPTVLISPLLSLMRNQIDNALRLGVVAQSINSQNVDEWEAVKNNLRNDACDILLISPEQLANKERITDLLSCIDKGIGLFVVDEAHCISDWGHDFRPDYRRIANIVNTLPPNIPVIATTATANQRVIEDIVHQLGDIEVLRGPLVRESLRLQTIKLADQAQRLAWLAENVPKLDGVGIIYCLTVSDCNKVSKWLQQNGICARAYTAKLNADERKNLEDMFMRNEVKYLVATVALGMGYDKPDIGFVIHYQRPGSVVSYYQQIGRAGRQLDNAFAILLNGQEDDDIQEYFINNAFPTEGEMWSVVSVIENSSIGLKQSQILSLVNMQPSRLAKCIKYLEVENVIDKDEQGRYARTTHQWTPDMDKSKAITRRRHEELLEIKQFVELHSCYMKFISQKLDDHLAKDCGKCTACTGTEFFPADVNVELTGEAIKFLKREHIEIASRKQWPAGTFAETQRRIPIEEQLQSGLALCAYGDAGWGKFIFEDKYVNSYFREELVDASVELIRVWLSDSISEMRAAYVPSLSRQDLVKSFAHRVASKLGIPCLDIIQKMESTYIQKELENSTHQCRNALESFALTADCPHCDILLIDDMVDSRWTLTVCGHMLRTRGAGLVYPFAIASTAGMKGDN